MHIVSIWSRQYASPYIYYPYGADSTPYLVYIIHMEQTVRLTLYILSIWSRQYNSPCIYYPYGADSTPHLVYSIHMEQKLNLKYVSG